MYTDILIQELHAQHAEIERAKDATRQDMIRLARNGQPSLPVRILDTIGVMLIAAGTYIQNQPSPAGSDRTLRTGTSGHRGLEHRSLSHSKT